MTSSMLQPDLRRFWEIVREQHHVITVAQLLAVGFTMPAIKHRVAKGRLHRIHVGVYAVGGPDLTRYGRWLAAVLACGPGAALSHLSAGALWELILLRGGQIDVLIDATRLVRRAGIRVHRRARLAPGDITRQRGIPVTTPACTLIDLAAHLPVAEVEAAVNEADMRGLVRLDSLRETLDATAPRPGVGRLKEMIDRRTFTLTRSQLERMFLPIAKQAGLPRPQTRAWVNGFEVDFFWPDLGLVVETDGLRYHRTPEQQAKDRIRDQAHAAAGLTPLRFTHNQVKFTPDEVVDVLRRVGSRLARRGAGP